MRKERITEAPSSFNSVEYKEKEKFGIGAGLVFFGLFMSIVLCLATWESVIAGRLPRLNVGTFAYGLYSLSIPFLTIVALNPLLRLLRLKIRVSSKAIGVMYLLLWMAANVGGSHYLYPAVITGLPYFSGVVGGGIFDSVINNISSLVLIKDQAAVTAAWRGGIINWGVWFWPIIFWSLLSIAFGMLQIFIACLVRRRWSEAERLIYPIVVPVVEMAKEDETGKQRFHPTFRDGVFWLGIAVGFGLVGSFLMRARLELGGTGELWNVGAALQEGLYSQSGLWTRVNSLRSIQWRFYPWMVGLAYMVGTNVLASGVFFAFLGYIIGYIIVATGGQALPGMTGDVGYSFGMGAGVMYGILILYSMRSQLKELWRSGASNDIIDEEGINPRIAFIGLGVCLLYLFLFMVGFFKVNIFVALLYLILLILPMLAQGRMRAEAGVPIGRRQEWRFDQWLIGASIGAARLGPQNIAGMGHLAPLSGPYYGGLGDMIPGTLEAFKASEALGIKKSSILKSLSLVMVVGTVLSILLSISFMHMLPGEISSRLVSQTKSQVVSAVETTIRGTKGGLLVRPEGTSVRAWAFGIGAIALAFFFSMHNLFSWWPLHPIGFVTAFTYLLSTFGN